MTNTIPYTRHPLDLPPGSVRALLALMITGLFVTLVLLPASQPVVVPMFLYPLMSLLLVFVATHGYSISGEGQKHPLHLPRGIIPLFLAAGIIAAVVWKYTNDRATLLARLQPSTEQIAQWPVLLAALFGGFAIGRLLRMGPWTRTAMYQDLLAWVSLLCMLGLGVVTLLVIFVHPSMLEGPSIPNLEAFLTAAVSLYYGARS